MLVGQGYSPFNRGYSGCVVSYDEATALIVVDVQNDFAHPNGSLYVSGGEKVIPFINDQIDEARRGGALVVLTQDWHPAATPHFQDYGGIWPVHCVGGTWGAELHDDLQAGPTDPRVRKGANGEDGYSGFTVADPKTGASSPTGLKDILNEAGIKRLVIVGLATDYCVKATVLDARRAGFGTTALADGIRPVELHPGDAEAAIEEMKKAGAQVI